MTRSINQLAFLNYVKYERLSELINFAYKDSNANKINLYIDLYPLIHSIYNDKLQINYNGYMDVVPLLLNLCAHYRYFFAKYYNVDTTIYLVAGRNHPEISVKIVPDYNRGMIYREQGPSHTVMDEMLQYNLQLLNILCPYLRDIHFLNTEFETGVAIAFIIDQQLDDTPNLVISKDIYPLQLAALMKNTCFLYPYKTAIKNNEPSQDISAIVRNVVNEETAMDFWKFYASTNHYKDFKINDYPIHPLNLSTMMAFSGMPERSLKNIMPNKTVLQYIYTIIGNAPTSCSVDSIFDQFDLDPKIPRHLVINRFHTLDIHYQLESIYRSSSEAILQHFENKIDPMTVKAIIDKYFNKDIPVNLDKLR